MPFDFSGKKILITGAGRGIGRELAKEIAKAGGDVYALSKTKELLESLAKESSNIHPLVVDLSDWEATKEAIDKLGAVDGVVNNAAHIDTFVDSLEISKERLEHAFSVNLMAPINIIQITAKKMKEAGIHGSIVNVSSIAGLNPLKNFMDYNVSKAGLDMVTKQFALELGRHQIRVNSLNTVWVLTDRVKAEMKEHTGREARAKSLIPAGRFCEVREAVEPTMYLLSDHSSMVNGTTHVVDGGFLSHIPV